MCVTDRHDMTLAVEVALNPNTTNQPDAILEIQAKLLSTVLAGAIAGHFMKVADSSPEG